MRLCPWIRYSTYRNAIISVCRVVRAKVAGLYYNQEQGNKKWEMGKCENGKMGNGEQKRGRQGERRDSSSGRGRGLVRASVLAKPSRAQLELTYTAPNHFRSRFYSCSLAYP